MIMNFNRIAIFYLLHVLNFKKFCIISQAKCFVKRNDKKIRRQGSHKCTNKDEKNGKNHKLKILLMQNYSLIIFVIQKKTQLYENIIFNSLCLCIVFNWLQPGTC